MRLCAIVIPVYTTKLSDFEMLSLNQCANVLGKHDLYFIIPDGLDLSKYELFIIRHNIKIRVYDKSYFKNLNSYNRLCYSADFYKDFKDYRYMLIYQLDAFVFYDGIEHFCMLDYDYIGAPWCNECNNVCNPEHNNKSLVGNGGLSLRKVSTFIDVMSQIKNVNAIENKHEDAFIRDSPQISKPSCSIARTFSVETKPDILILKYGITPMGYHKMFGHCNSELLPYLHHVINIRLAKKSLQLGTLT